jgi:hypothetical protein
MIKKISSSIVLLILTFGAIAQSVEKIKKSGRPDIPGTFALELGVNRMTERPNQVKYGLWGSRTLNLYYQYDMRIGKSKFTFHPGIGFSMERFKFQSFQQYFPNDTIKKVNPTLMFDNSGNTIFVDAAHYIYDKDTLNQISYAQSYTTKKTMLAMNYIDIPVELRFNLNPEDPARSFKVAIGGRVGYLLGAHTKIRYRENHELKKLKNNQDFNLSPFRYSVYMKIYFGNFSIFSYYNLNPLWKANKGPNQTQAQTYTIGISLASF